MQLFQKIDWSLAKNAGVDISVLRLDRISNTAPGNKFFKLKLNLAEAENQQADCVASFGGNWSNHIHALAASAHEKGLRSIGFIRGDATETAMLQDARRWGMHIEFVGFGDYRRRYDPSYHQNLKSKFGDFYLIPEGGSNLLGAKGCADIPTLIPESFETIVCPVATGGTFAGIVSAIKPAQRAIGFAVLPDRGHMNVDIKALLAKLKGEQASEASWCLEKRFDFGGYARSNEELLLFMSSFTDETAVPLDFVYTGKLFYGLAAMLKAGELAPGKLVAVHTGGLQGQRGAAA